MSNKKRFKFADEGPGVAVVIRNIIMNRDEAEAHIAAGGAVEKSAKRVWYSLVGTFGNVYELCTSLQTNSIESGLEWKDTLVVMDTTSEPSSNNAMQLDTLIRRERSVKYQDIGSGVLEARNIGVLLVKILFVDCPPGLLMNLLSLYRTFNLYL